ncbi:MAG: AI-2E family transporter, partial [Armatimonadetes bacterium]|nr:AI-2E family transporter [Armatimonadota bacterium]
AYLLDPLVDRLEERGFSRTSGTVVVFSVFFLAALGLALVLVPPLIDQVTSLVSACLPPEGRYYLLALQLLDFVEAKILKGEIPAFLEQGFQRVLEQLGNFLLAKLQGAISTLTGLFSLIVLPFIVFFALQIVDPLRERIRWWVPAEYREPLSGLVKEVGQLVGRYVRGYIVLCFAVGVAETIFLLICRWIFGMDYVLAVGIFGGATYAIPYFGALLTTLIGGLVAYTTAHHHQVLCAVVVAVGLIVINQAFDWLIMPRVVGRQVGLHPLTVLFAVMAGGTMLGILGMLLAVPIAGAVKLALQTLFPRHFAPMTEEANAVKMTAGDHEKRGEGQ